MNLGKKGKSKFSSTDPDLERKALSPSAQLVSSIELGWLSIALSRCSYRGTTQGSSEGTRMGHGTSALF